MNDNIKGNDARILAAAQDEMDTIHLRRTGNPGIGIIFWMLLIGTILVGVFTYLPGQLDSRYTGTGQVIGMINPSGDNPDVDMQYSQVNQGNANANLTNSKAYQRQSVIWIAWIFGFVVLGIVIFILRRAFGEKEK